MGSAIYLTSIPHAHTRDHSTGWIDVPSPHCTFLRKVGESEDPYVAAQFEYIGLPFQAIFPGMRGNLGKPREISQSVETRAYFYASRS
jgi:hypothetical protein